MSNTSAPRLAIIAALSLALVASLLFGAGGRAEADEPVVPVAAAPDLNWGFKQTWRNYAQEPQVSGGAEVVPSSGAATYDLEWAFESGTYDPATQTTRLDFEGTAHWQKYKASQLGWPAPPGYSGEPDPYILDVTLSDPQITISKDSSVLTVVATSRDQATWQLISYGRVPIVNLDVFGVTPAIAGGTTTWAGIVATVTPEGRDAMAGNYRTGQVVDSVGFSYAGPGGAPDFSEQWDTPGTVALKLVQNEFLIDSETPVGMTQLWVDRRHMIAHSFRTEVVDGVSVQKVMAFSLAQMKPAGSILLQGPERIELSPLGAFDANQQRLLYRSGAENGMRRWLRYDPVDEKYEAGMLADPQMGESDFFGISNPRLAWDPIRERGFRIARVVPVGVSEEDFDQQEWQLMTFEEGAGGTWVKKVFKLPNFPAGQNQNGFASTTAAVPAYATASDGSLIVLATPRLGLDASATIPGAYRIVFNESDDAAQLLAVPGSEVLNATGAGGTFKAVQASANGHFLLIRTNSGQGVHCQIEAGTVDCDPPFAVQGNVEGAPYDETRYALDPADGTVWFAGITSQKLAAFRDGAFRGAQFFKERNPKGGPVLVGDDHFVYAQTNDGSPGESGGSKTWGYGKFERLGFVPAVTAQPQPDTVALSSGEESEEATFSSTASGEPAPQRQWQVKAPGSNKFVDLAGESGPTLSVAATRSDDGAEFRAVYSNAAGEIATDPAALGVDYAPQVLQSPAPVKATEGADAEFAVLADGKPEPAVTWQRRVNGFWENVTDEDESLLVEGNSLTVVGTNPDQSGAQFRARLTNSLGTATSEPAKLTVTPKVTIPAGGVEVEKATLEWSGSAELQKAPPFGGSNYFSAGVSGGDEASFRGHEGEAFVFQVSAGGSEAIATWATRADHVTNGGAQLARLYGGSGTVEEDGSAVVEWEGAFSVNFYGGLAPFTLSDLVLRVDEGGAGELSADLVGCASSMANPNECNPLPPVADVTVATFSGVEVDPGGELSVTPDYAGVETTVPGGTAPQDRSGPGWGAWPQPFVDYHVETGLAPYWYSSGGAADPLKAPLPFTVDLAGEDAPVVDEEPPGGGNGGGGGPPPQAPPVPVSPSIGPAKGVQAVGGKRRAKVATLHCPGASPCR